MNSEHSEILNRPVEHLELQNAIGEIKAEGKCSDASSVNPIMLKHLGSTARDLLIKAFNWCLATGEWAWTHAEVCFIRKPEKSSYLDPSSYRPITISSYIGKLLEKIVEKRLRFFYELTDLFDETQEGFCPNRSTSRYLYKLISKLSEAKRKKLNAMVLFIDFSKAFDSVCVKGLLVKLHRNGVVGNILHLLKNFLTNRTISIRLNGKVYSARQCSLLGLPQGSVIAPLLFIIFVRDLPLGTYTSSGSTQVDMFKYADDGTVSVIDKDLMVCHRALQEICNAIYHWCCKWRLKINCSKNKTEIIILRSGAVIDHTVDDLPKIRCGRSTLQYVRKSKVLGVIIDDMLTFKNHAAGILKRCWYDWYRVSKNTTRMKGLNTPSLSLLFNSVICSKILYASPVWLSKQIDTFKRFWSRVIMKLSGSEYYPERNVAELALKIPPLQLQDSVHTTKFLLKCLFAGDEFLDLLTSIEETDRHAYAQHIQLLKQWSAWRRSHLDTTSSPQPDITRNSTRGIDLSSIISNRDSDTTLKYTKAGMRKFLYFLWHRKIKHQHPNKPVAPWTTLGCLTPRRSSRCFNSVVLEFVHGHSTRFGNFRKSLGMSATDKCDHCGDRSDSPEHQLFFCRPLDCDFRGDLLAVLEEETEDYNWRILTGPLNEVACSTLTYLVKSITEDSSY